MTTTGRTVGDDLTSAIRWDRDGEVVILTLDQPGESANTLTPAHVAAMTVVLQRLRDELESITGVVLTSAKPTFFAGGDLNQLITYRLEDAPAITADVTMMKNQLRDLETLGIPVVAAINGAALGGGLELALAAHYRVIADVPGAVVGFPEVGLGLLPGLGGIVRTVRMLGVVPALHRVLLTGRRFRPAAAQELGLIDEIVATVGDLLPAARRWLAGNPAAVQPWDRADFSMPGGVPSDPGLAGRLPALPSTLRKQLNGSPAPAPRAILAAAVEGAQVDMGTATQIETRYFVSLATGQIAKNLIRSTFFDLRSVNAGVSRPPAFDRSRVSRVGVIGAGMMGTGIAQVCAAAGIDVILADVDLAAARSAKVRITAELQKAVSAGRLADDAMTAALGLITPTDDSSTFADADLVIEAVFESAELKHRIYSGLEPTLGNHTILGTNTSTLPITELAGGVSRPDSFIGIHFFSPVPRMPLVEIVVGAATSDETIARTFDFARQIGKTPIVVNDGRGFFTSRVILAFIREAIAAVGEGVEPTSIEQAGLQAGYPAGPLQLLDELTLTLPRDVRREARTAALASGQPWLEHPADRVLDSMIDDLDRRGRSTGGGFYDYVDGRRTGLWPGLRDSFGTGGSRPPLAELIERMLFAEAIEAVRCLDDGVLRSVADANVGSLLGIGFPAWTGGVLQYINSYPGGPAGFVDRARELAIRYGAPLEPPASLVAMAAAGGRYE